MGCRQRLVKKIVELMMMGAEIDAKYDADRNTLFVENWKLFFNEKDEVVKILDFTTGNIYTDVDVLGKSPFMEFIEDSQRSD